MKVLLSEDDEYSYLQMSAQDRLRQARSLAGGAGLNNASLVPLSGNTYALFPWMGSIAYHTPNRILRFMSQNSPGIKCTGGLPPYYLILQMDNCPPSVFFSCLQKLSGHGMRQEDLVRQEENLVINKYDEFIPSNLLGKAFAANHMYLSALNKPLLLTR